MASFTFASVADLFGVGTTVGAYLPSLIPGAASPVTGAAITTAVVQANGSLTFVGLVDDTAYVAYDGSHARRFRARPVVVESGLVVNALENGARGKDGFDDGIALQAIVTEMNAQLGAGQRGTLYLPIPDDAYRIKSILHAGVAEIGHPGSSNHGIEMGRVSVQCQGEGMVPIEVDAGINTNIFHWEIGLSAVATITADVAQGADLFTVDALPTGLAVGDEVYIRLGVSTFDSAEVRWWDFARVVAISGLTIQLAANAPFPVLSSIAAIHRSIQKVTTPLDDLSLTGSPVFKFLGAPSDDARHACALWGTRRFYGKAVGYDVGSGIFQGAYNIDAVLDVDVRQSRVVMPAAGIGGFQPRGRATSLFSSVNTLVRGSHNGPGPAVYSESGNRSHAVGPLKIHVPNRYVSTKLLANTSIGATTLRIGTALAADAASAATSITVASTGGIYEGRRLRIGSETVTVGMSSDDGTAVNATTGVVKLTAALAGAHTSGDEVYPADVVTADHYIEIGTGIGTLEVRAISSYNPATGVVTLAERTSGAGAALASAHTAGETVRISRRPAQYLLWCGGDSDLPVHDLTLTGDPNDSVMSFGAQDGQGSITNLTDLTKIGLRRACPTGRLKGIYRTIDKTGTLRTWDMDSPRVHKSTLMLVDAVTSTIWHPNGLLKETEVSASEGVLSGRLALTMGRELVSSSALAFTAGQSVRSRYYSGALYPRESAWEQAIKTSAVCSSGTAHQTTITENAASGQKNLYVASASNIAAGVGLQFGTNNEVGIVASIASTPDAGHGNGYLVILTQNISLAGATSGATVSVTLATDQVSGSTAVVAGDRTVVIRNKLNNIRVGSVIVVSTGATREMRTVESISTLTLTVDRPFAQAHSVQDKVFTRRLEITSRTCWPVDAISEPSTLLTTDGGTTYVDTPERWRPEAVYF